MKLFFKIAVISFLAVRAFGISQSPEGKSGATVPHFWRVTKGAEVKYLLGSLHGVSSQGLDPEVRSTLESAKQFMTEIEPDKAKAFAFKHALMQLLAKADYNWETKLTPASWQKVIKINAAQPEPLALDKLRALAPSEIASLVLGARTPEISEAGRKRISELNVALAKSPGSFDRELYEAAVAKNIPTHSLDDETALARTMQEPEPDIEKLLQVSSSELENEMISFYESRLAIRTGYHNNDVRPFKKETREFDAETRSRMVTERNNAWVTKLIAQSENSFIVVGTAHLYGRDGLLALLKARGYKIEPVSRSSSGAKTHPVLCRDVL